MTLLSWLKAKLVPSEAEREYRKARKEYLRAKEIGEYVLKVHAEDTKKSG